MLKVLKMIKRGEVLCEGWPKISIVLVYSSGFLIQICRKLPFVMPTAGVKQRPRSMHLLLALLDYVSRGHEIEICPSSVRVAIISEPNARISSNFGCCFLWAIPSGFVLIFKKKTLI